MWRQEDLTIEEVVMKTEAWNMEEGATSQDRQAINIKKARKQIFHLQPPDSATKSGFTH